MKTVLCFGEALWDCLPAGRFVGGAPLNVAFHLNQLGVRAWPVSAVGADILGAELLNAVRGWGVETRYITEHEALPTGTVTATLDPSGNAHYQIHEGVAWDDIEISPQLAGRAEEVDAIVYGTLAQRSALNRHRLSHLIELCPGALKVCDVNLRPPFDSVERAWELATEADLVKLNENEIVTLLEDTARQHTLEALAREMSEQTGAESICVTAGEKGAGLLFEQEWHWVDAEPVVVVDTIGAGDAFLAALVASLLEPDAQPWECLHRACRLGEFVVSQRGATPSHRQ